MSYLINYTIPQLNNHFNISILGYIEQKKLNKPNTKLSMDKFYAVVRQLYSWYFKYEALQSELNENDPRHPYMEQFKDKILQTVMFMIDNVKLNYDLNEIKGYMKRLKFKIEEFFHCDDFATTNKYLYDMVYDVIYIITFINNFKSKVSKVMCDELLIEWSSNTNYIESLLRIHDYIVNDGLNIDDFTTENNFEDNFIRICYYYQYLGLPMFIMILLQKLSTMCKNYNWERIFNLNRLR